MRHFTPEQRQQVRLTNLALAGEHQLAQRDAQEKAAQQARVDEIKKWDAAYVLAHDGQSPPLGYVPPIVIQAPLAPAVARTNTLAILSLIFGLLGGWLGLLFGIIALSQIKRTGESGRGMAIVGIIAALIWIVVIIIGAIVAFSLNR
jgi:hypothetical protein